MIKIKVSVASGAASDFQVLEDFSLEALLNQEEGHWEITCTDSLSGKSRKGVWNDKELMAVLNLVLPNESPENVDELYEIAEPLVKEWPIELRPFP